LPVLVQSRSIQVEFTEGQRLRLERGILAVQPGAALVRLEVRLGQEALDGAATHVAVMRVLEDLEGEIVEGPVRNGHARVGRLGRDEDKNLVALLRGKKPAGDRSAGGRAAPGGGGGRSGSASGRRCPDHRRVRRRPGGWWACRVGRNGE